MRFKRFTQNSNEQADEKNSHPKLSSAQHHICHKPNVTLQMSSNEMVILARRTVAAMEPPSLSHCQLKRSNAIRVKEKNFDILPASVRQSILAFHSIKPAQRSLQPDSPTTVDSFNFCDQIKQGVLLHPVKRRNGTQRSNETGSNLSTDSNESLADILARVLAKRHSVMQLTDNESEPSSIDSQEDDDCIVQNDELEFAPTDTGAVASQAASGGGSGERIIDHALNPMDVDMVSVVEIEHGKGNVELIAHL